jgi:Platelet-activating factor acetylhydrolase, isoform II
LAIPAPTGQHRVGRLALDLTDERRRDPYAKRETRRRLGVWVWYPANPGRAAKPGAYLPGWWGVLGPVWGFWPSRVRVSTVPDAPVDATRAPYPVLVFSPSGNPPHFYSALLEELASHGYVVVGISHTYETIPISVLPGGWQAAHERADPGYSVLVRGAGHASFIDWPLLPLWRFALARRGLGSPAPGVVWRVTSDWLLGFFGKHLRGATESALDSASADDRVTVGPPRSLFQSA